MYSCLWDTHITQLWSVTCRMRSQC